MLPSAPLEASCVADHGAGLDGGKTRDQQHDADDIRPSLSWHFSGVYRLFAKRSWAADSMSYRLFTMMFDSLLPAGSVVEMVLDDTLNGQRGKNICSVGWRHDGPNPEESGRKRFGLLRCHRTGVGPAGDQREDLLSALCSSAVVSQRCKDEAQRPS